MKRSLHIIQRRTYAESKAVLTVKKANNTFPIETDTDHVFVEIPK